MALAGHVLDVRYAVKKEELGQDDGTVIVYHVDMSMTDDVIEVCVCMWNMFTCSKLRICFI